MFVILYDRITPSSSAPDRVQFLPHWRRGLTIRVASVLHVQVQEAAQAYVPVSHLLWGIWGLLQARLSDVPSFEFTEYGRQRLREFRRLQPTATTENKC
jgi:hypothetical protein